MPTPESTLPFGKHRGRKLKSLPLGYLQWMAGELRDSDFHDWAVAAEQYLKTTGRREQRKQDLKAEADRILREHDIDPDRVEP